MTPVAANPTMIYFPDSDSSTTSGRGGLRRAAPPRPRSRAAALALALLLAPSERASARVACGRDGGVFAQSGGGGDAGACWVSDATQFDGLADGHRYSVDDARREFADARGPYKMLDGADVGSAKTVVREDALVAEYGAGLISGKKTGFTFYSDADEPADEAWMAYDLRVSEGFEFTRGGKLPGLCGGPTDGSGRACPVGCSSVDDEDGFSARLMWRRDGAIVSYLYYPDKPSSIRCGEDLPWAARIVPGQWHEIRMRVKLNTVNGDTGEARSDGVLEAWFDGDQVLGVTNAKLRRNPSVQITRTYLTTYVGGSSVSLFAPSRDQHAAFRNIRSWPGPSPEPPCGRPAEDDDGGADAAAAPSDSSADGATPAAAPSKLYDYDLARRGRGWDRPGFYSRVRVPKGSDRASVFASLRFCRGACEDAKRACRAFTLYGTSCYLKNADAMAREPKFYGRGASGWRYMYERSDDDGDVVAQSGPPTPCGDEGEECCYASASREDAPLCGAGACASGACVCSGAVCVNPSAGCGDADGGVCAQSAAEECGGLRQACCPGSECGEDLVCGADGACADA